MLDVMPRTGIASIGVPRVFTVSRMDFPSGRTAVLLANTTLDETGQWIDGRQCPSRCDGASSPSIPIVFPGVAVGDCLMGSRTEIVMVSLLTSARFHASRVRLVTFQQTRSESAVEIPRHRLILPWFTTGIEEPELVPPDSHLAESGFPLLVIIVGIEGNFPLFFANLIPLILERPTTCPVRQPTRMPDVPKSFPARGRQPERTTQLVRLFPRLSRSVAFKSSNSEKHVPGELTNRSRDVDILCGTEELPTRLLDSSQVKRNTISTAPEATKLPYPDFSVYALLHELDATHDFPPEVPPGGIFVYNPCRDKTTATQGGVLHNALLDVDADHFVTPRGNARVSKDRNQVANRRTWGVDLLLWDIEFR